MEKQIVINTNNQTFYYLHSSDLIIITNLQYKDLILNPPNPKNKYKFWEFNHKHKLLFYRDTNNKKKYLAGLISGLNHSNISVTFIDNDHMNYRYDNLQVNINNSLNNTHPLIDSQKYIILQYFPGHIINIGKSANKELNPYWLVHDNQSNEKYYLMYCEGEGNIFVKLCQKGIEKINNIHKIIENIDNTHTPTWSKFSQYISAHIKFNDNTKKIATLHSFITNHLWMGKGKGIDSVDHINQNKLDNRLSNLRIVSQSIQNQNRGKVARKKNAQPLPVELTPEELPLPKFSYYCKEYTNKEKTKYQESFVIEKHPAIIPKRWRSSRSYKISINQKLLDTKNKIKELDNILLQN